MASELDSLIALNDKVPVGPLKFSSVPLASSCFLRAPSILEESHILRRKYSKCFLARAFGLGEPHLFGLEKGKGLVRKTIARVFTCTSVYVYH